MDSGFGAYRRGFADGQDVLFDQILSGFDEDPHPIGCGCKPCRVVSILWGEAMRNIREMIGPREWQRLCNSLGAALDQAPGPPYSA